MGQDPEAGGIAILGRFLDYAEKVFELSDVLSQITDSRSLPQIPTITVAKSVLVMSSSRLGSLNAIEQLKGSAKLRKHVEDSLPSADSLGRIFALVDTRTVRRVTRHIYDRLKRNKALEPPGHGLIALAIDGHESHATYMQKCSGCLERDLGDDDGEKIQYYHRNVTAQLNCLNCCFLLDAESQQSGECEVSCAIRLLDRAVIDYPRAFDVVVADALYAKSNFVNRALEHKRDVIVVLKDERRELFKDAEALFAGQEPTYISETAGVCTEYWDADGFLSWSQVKQPLRVVMMKQTTSVRRQLTKKIEEKVSTWIWATTLSPHRANTKVVAQLGRSRWCIENQGFNELVNHWHADHVYKHDPVAILNFWLMSMIAYNLFRAFYLRNLKSALRKGKTMLHFARMILASLYSDLAGLVGVPP